MLTAQHTHSAPSGYTPYVIYSLPAPGFVPRVFNTFRDGVVEAIVRAWKSKIPATVRLAVGEFAPDVPVAFNRSISAYNQNKDVEPMPAELWHWAVDRDMTLLRFDGLDGTPIGSINWFAVHTTSIHSDKTTIHSDNKGIAATLMEERCGGVAIFAQSNPGDVTPNFMRHKRDKVTRGPTPDDYENARIHGEFQFDLARRLYEKAADAPPRPVQVDAVAGYFDLSATVCEPEFTDGEPGCRTGPGVYGITFFTGTAEGGGVSQAVFQVAKSLALLAVPRDLAVQGKKIALIETVNHQILGTQNYQTLLGLAAGVHPYIKLLKQWADKGIIGAKPLAPQVLPVQLAVLGGIGLAALPGEPTTVAGRRIRRTLLPRLADLGIDTVVVGGYANGFGGYITTHEEYEVQRYEGGHTLYGKWTCAAYQTILCRLAEALHTQERSPLTPHRPDRFTPEELEARTVFKF
jgi:neutral ceramidase